MDYSFLYNCAGTLTAIKYSFFVIIAILINLFFQYLVDLFYTGILQFYVSIAAGTCAGLVVKYVLDKNYIFYFETESFKKSISKLFLYSLMGVITTIIFWGTEFLFYYVFNSSYAKYFGGLLGLSLGYLTKYHLDKNFVFIKQKG